MVQNNDKVMGKNDAAAQHNCLTQTLHIHGVYEPFFAHLIERNTLEGSFLVHTIIRTGAIVCASPALIHI